jgi:lipopolysaccharide/colanic/teichoic acid biosynthesis glycosyltransferase/glycosyltransferase involved in cell wall biosynthesis
MNILFVVPYPPSAIRVRSQQLIRGLARRGHKLTVATLWSDDAERAAVEKLMEEGFEVVSRRLTTARSGWNCLRCLPSREPLQAAFSWQPELAGAIHRYLSAQDIDIVHVEHLRGARFARDLASGCRGSVRPPIVWDAVDCISHLFCETLRHGRSRRGRWMARLDLERTRRCESTLPFELDRTVVCAEPDKDRLEDLLRGTATAPGTWIPPIEVVPNGVDLGYFTPTEEASEPATLVLSGKMSYHANVTAALHLMGDIMPHVWSRRPDVKLSIVGQAPPRALRQLATREADRITLTGYVPDVRPHLRRATLSVVPLLYGAGTQLKVLEAMACGTPVVSTAVGTNGLGLRHGRDVVVANQPKALADEILDLLEKPDRRERFARAGRRYVEREHSWDVSARRLESIYLSVLEDPEVHPQGTSAWSKRPLSTGQIAVKTAIDYAVAALLLPALAPLLMLLTALIKLDSPGPALHRRRVLGRGGRSFDAFKLRTMKLDGEQIPERVPDRNGAIEADSKVKDDPRVTRVGHWLRRFSLDEVPQLLNVLRGEMSLVGPRMMSPAELGRYGAAGHHVLSVKPGITGLWQVSGRADLPPAERVRLDAEYVRGFSLRGDIKILVVDTPLAVLTGRGAY